MAGKRLRLGDQLRAESRESLSWFAVHIPPILTDFAGRPVGAKHYTQLRWFNSLLDADTINWHVYQGDESAGRFPKSHRMAGMVRVEKVALDEYQEQYGGVQSIAVRVGTTAVLGVMCKKEQPLLVDDAENPGLYVVAKHVGRQGCELAVGLWTPTMQFISPPAPEHVEPKKGHSLAYIADLPASIPVV
jgi:hypothetical protein